MRPMLRKRLNCHYCGQRLNAARKSNSKINCANCSADNYLDSLNNIVDVPASEASQPHTSDSHLVEVESASDVFCKTCLTNQSFYRHALADYLPDEDDPRYEELEKALPEFQRDLELRYPQCCVQCEPRVQARIQSANYAAKTDHLRRTVRRRHNRQNTSASRFRSLLISMAGLGHLSGLLMQLVWHGVASQAVGTAESILPRTTTLGACLRTWPVSSGCASAAVSMVPASLFISLICIWWNPEWQRRLSGQEGRLRGLRSYYITQLSILTLRFAVWLAVQELPAVRPYTAVVHAMTFVLLIMSSFYAHFAMIHLDTTPLVDWSKANRPLVDPDQFHPPTREPVPASSSSSSQFSVDSLAGPRDSVYDQWQPPTPPGDDSMDWAPTSHAFNPRPRPPKPRFDQPSPFYGTLPAAPVRGSLDPRRPEQTNQQKAIGVPPGFFGLSKSKNQDRPASLNDKPEFGFAPARFFAHEQEADTGLENIFDKMFSVKDPLEPTLARTTHPKSQPKARSSSNPSKTLTYPNNSRTVLARMVVCCSVIVGLIVVTISNGIVDLILPEAQQSASNLMLYAASVPALHIFDQIVLSSQTSNEYLAVPIVQGLILAITKILKPIEGSIYVPFWNKLVIAVMCLLLLQEIYRFCQLQSSSATVATAQMAQSIGRTEKVPPQRAHSPPFGFESNIPTFSQQETQVQPTTDLSGNFPLQAASRSPQRNPFAAYTANTSPIRKQASDESISSVSSIQTTSTASGWKTPHNESRTYDWREHERTSRRPTNTIARGLGGLSLDNDFGLGSGTGIAGPRTRSQASRSARGNNLFGR